MMLAHSSRRSSRLWFGALLGAFVTLVSVGAGSVPVVALAATGELPINGRIVFAHDRDVLIGYDIRSIRASGSGITHVSEATASEYTPQVSPDGTKIAYVIGGHIAVMNIDGSGQHRLTDTGPTDYQSGGMVRWSPDGATLAYLSGGHIYTTPVSGGERHLVSDGVTEVDHWGYAWSPDSTRLAFGAWDSTLGEDNVYVATADGSSLDRITVHQDGEYEGSTCPPCWYPLAVDWSPDGSTLAYTRHGDIWTIHPDGSADTLIVPSGYDKLSKPQWSPTGGQLLYLTQGLDAPGIIGVVDADGRNNRYIGEWGVWDATWSPNGTAIAFSGVLETRRRPEIYTIPAAGGTPTRLTFNNRSDVDPDWAPGCSITGTSGADVLEGTTERDYICGGAGDDKISGFGGDDVLLGGSGADTVMGGAGNDVVAGERGMDQLWGGRGDDTVNGRDGLTGERLAAGHGNDRCRRDARDVLLACETIDRDLH